MNVSNPLVEIIDPLGHISLMRNGYDYMFNRGPEYLHNDGEARRATFRQFQGYPANSVQGAGQLVKTPANYDDEGGIPNGTPWMLTQPPQTIQHLVPIRADIFGGGFPAGQFVMQPLINTNP